VRHAAAIEAEADRRGRLAEPDEPGVGARARRKPLGPEMHRLEEVRLPGSVLARHEHDAGREREVERRIRAEVPERDVRDDQAAPRTTEPL
jgi:hypothetical protein